MAHRDFALPGPDEPGPTFTLEGVTRVWHCKPGRRLSLGTMLRMYAAIAGGDEAAAVLQIGPFFKAVLVKEDREAFGELLDDDDSPLSIEMLQPVMEWLISELVARPSEPPGDSSPGASSTGPSSPGGSSSPATLQVASGG